MRTLIIKSFLPAFCQRVKWITEFILFWQRGEGGEFLIKVNSILKLISAFLGIYYMAATAEQTPMNLEAFARKWDEKHTAISVSWQTTRSGSFCRLG